MRRRVLYLLCVFLFFAVLIGIPLAIFLHRPPSCSDGIQNQDETSPDHGGPCLLLDDTAITPHAILWARSFKVRDGVYDSVAYVENPNNGAGVAQVGYRFGLYDSANVAVAEKKGVMYVMPGGITPVFDSDINTGNRDATHTRFEFTGPLVWERMQSVANAVKVTDKEMTDQGTMPRLTASVTNTLIRDITNISFVAVVFDPAGNAFASSATKLTRLNAGETKQIVFTWPLPFAQPVGRLDVLPLLAPIEASHAK